MKQLKIVIPFLLLALMLASCRAGDCGCPMSMEEKTKASESFQLTPRPLIDAVEFSSTESHLHYHQRNDTW